MTVLNKLWNVPGKNILSMTTETMALLNMVFVLAIPDTFLIPHKIWHLKAVSFFREPPPSKQHTLGLVNRDVSGDGSVAKVQEVRGGGRETCFKFFTLEKITIKEKESEQEHAQLWLGLSQELGIAILALRRLNQAPSDLLIKRKRL